MSDPDFIQAHKHGIRHKAELLASEQCGCFYCLAIFRPTVIESWIDECNPAGQTALCPFCGIDSVIGSASGFPITQDFLRRIKKHWF
jgi:hypothetical protein